MRPTHLYALSGVRLESELPLPCTPLSYARVAPPGGPPMSLRLASPADSPPPASFEPSELRDTGLRVARRGERYFVSAPLHASFAIDRAGSSVTCFPRPDCPEGVIKQLFLDQVFPLALHARGRFAFHASAAALGGVAVAFLGRSGLGKSTLAAWLARQAGGALFSDDCLAVEPAEGGVVAHPSYPSARLWPPSAGALFADRGELPAVSPRSDKRRVELAASTAPAPLGRLYLLEAGDGAPVIRRLKRAEALVALTAHLHRLDTGDRERLAGELDLLDHVARHVPVARLAYRRSFAMLDEVRDALVADLDA